jgi:cytochrome c oxidase subunit II
MGSSKIILRGNRHALSSAVLAGLALAACSGPQSTLDPGGRSAEQISTLFWWMTAGGAVIWVGVLGMAFYAVRANPDVDRRRTAHLWIVGGAVTPAVVLGGLLIYGLGILPAAIAPAPEGSLRIEVYGEQWWWRVRYQPPGRQSFDVANEIRLPVGEPVQFLLHSKDVIHSFWIPSLGGKMDMIPGRVNRLSLHPTRIGHFRGACAEYCGKAHAQMAFEAVVTSRSDFDRWVAQQSEPAPTLADPTVSTREEQP